MLTTVRCERARKRLTQQILGEPPRAAPGNENTVTTMLLATEPGLLLVLAPARLVGVYRISLSDILPRFDDGHFECGADLLFDIGDRAQRPARPRGSPQQLTYGALGKSVLGREDRKHRRQARTE